MIHPSSVAVSREHRIGTAASSALGDASYAYEQHLDPFHESGSHMTLRWREPDSNLYGAFPVK